MDKTKSLALVVFVFVFAQCVEDHSLIGRSITRTFTSVAADEVLREAKNNIENTEAYTRTKTGISESVNWSRAYKFENPALEMSAYTLPILTKTRDYFDNLVIVKNESGLNFFILRHKPSKHWYSKKEIERKLTAFSGEIELLDLSGRLLGRGSSEEGKSRSQANSRVAGCIAWVTVEWTEVTAGGNTRITEINFSEVIVCDALGSGGGTEGDPLGGIFGGGSGSDFGIGVLDPVDVSYFLRPTREGDDVNNPYDGMIAIDKNGVAFTYNAELKVWLMPDLIVLAQSGFKLNISLSNYQNKILSTVTTISLIEPTPIGEAILGSLILTIFIYEMSQVSTVNYDHIEICLEKWKNCDHTRQKCYDCYRYCEAQKYWPTYPYMCP